MFRWALTFFVTFQTRYVGTQSLEEDIVLAEQVWLQIELNFPINKKDIILYDFSIEQIAVLMNAILQVYILIFWHNSYLDMDIQNAQI